MIKLKRLISSTKSLLYSIPTILSNIKFYLPLIIKDRQFDYSYMWRFFHAKLSRMESYYSDDTNYYTEDNGRLASIQQARTLCERIMNDEYESEEMESHYAKFGEFELEFIQENEFGGSMVIKRANVNTKDEESLAREHLQTCLIRADVERAMDINELCEMLKYESKGWWD